MMPSTSMTEKPLYTGILRLHYFEIALLGMENRGGNFPEISNVSAFCRLVENNKN